MRNCRLKYTLYMLAVDVNIKSELNSKVTQMLGHSEHAYEMEWEDASMNNVTLSDMLRILTRLGRQADVGIIYCVRMQDTLAKKKLVRHVTSEAPGGSLGPVRSSGTTRRRMKCQLTEHSSSGCKSSAPSIRRKNRQPAPVQTTKRQ